MFHPQTCFMIGFFVSLATLEKSRIHRLGSLWLVTLFVFVFVCGLHVMHATVAEFNKLTVFVKDLVVLAGFREVLLDNCSKGFACWNYFTEGKLNLIAVIFLSLCGER